MRAKNPPILQYICLALLFAIASGYQIRSAMFAFPNYFHLKAAAYPFVPVYENGRPALQFVTRSARQAGVQNNDILLTVNGRPLTGIAAFGRDSTRAVHRSSYQSARRLPIGTEARRAHVLHPAWILGHGRAPTRSLGVVSFPHHAVFLCVL